MEASTAQPGWLTALFVWTTLCLLSSGQSAPDASGLPLAIRVPLRQGARAEQPPPLPPAASHRERGNAGKHGAVRRRRGAAASGISFVDMIDNLRGKSGQGYYVEMAVGSPPQKVKGSSAHGGINNIKALLHVQSVEEYNHALFGTHRTNVSEQNQVN